jgi:tRNA(Glu) U13 pseudouridine synthase TruD
VLLYARDFRGNWEGANEPSGQSDWKLAFELPRGAYATMIIRQLFLDGLEIEDSQNPTDEFPEHSHESL